MEVWKNHDKYNYEVSNMGNVRGLRFKKNLKGQPNSSGYLRVQLSYAGNRFFIHRLVAELFIENSYDKNYVNHIDGNKINNKASNLEWVTASENDKHKYEYGLAKPKRGEDSHRAKLKNNDVYSIINLLNKRCSCSEIAKKFNVHRKTVNDIKQGKTWSLLTNGRLQTLLK